MRWLLYYFKLQLKNSVRTLPTFLGSLVVLLCLIVLSVPVAGKLAGDTTAFQKVQVGFVVPDDSKTTEKMLSYFEAMESVKNVSDFQIVKEEKALERLGQELDVVVKLSPDFYDDVNNGINSPVTIYMADTNAVSNETFKELLCSGVRFVQVTEASIYGMTKTMQVEEAESTVSEMEDIFTKLYVYQVLKREEAFDAKILGQAEVQSLSGYYITAGMLLMLSLLGMCFGFLYKEEDLEMVRVIRRGHLRATSLSLVNTLVMTVLLFCFSLLLFGGLKVLSLEMDLEIFLLNGTTLFALLVLSICFACYFHMFYGVFGKMEYGAVAIFLVNVWMFLCSGILVPFYHVSQWMLSIRSLVAITVWQHFLYAQLYQNGAGAMLGITLLFAAVFEVVGVIGLCKRM